MKDRPTLLPHSGKDRSANLRRLAEARVLEASRPGSKVQAAMTPMEVQAALHDLQVHQIELEMQNEELRRAQDALEGLHARYFDLYDLAPVGYFTLDDQGLILEANLTGAVLLGVTRGALVGKHFSRFVVAEDADHYYLQRRALVKTGEPCAFELRLDKNTAHVTVWIDATLAIGDNGAPVCRLVVSDISERRAIEEQLRRKQNLLQTAGSMALVGGWAIDLPLKVLTWSDEMGALFEYSPGVTPSLTEMLSLGPRASHETLSAALTVCAELGTSFDFELEMFTARRRSVVVRVIGKGVRGATGLITRIEGAMQDITARRQGEQAQTSLATQLRESQKMEAIGTLAAGIAHDFNNILGTILGNAELARADCGWNPKALESLEEINKAGRRAHDLVQQILSFSRRQPTARRVMSLAPVVEESVRLMRAVVPGGARLDYYCSAETPAILANPTQVKQVLLNLGANAAFALQERPGDIRIAVESFCMELASERPDLHLRPGLYARIVFSDTGHGMDAATQRRIFDPFFTTKPAGEGTGLGLSVVHGIMQTHEGAIFLRSEPGKGSAFELYFPAASASSAAQEPTEAPGQSSEGRGQHIFYIEDDESQLFMVKRLLERWGYQATTFREQYAALDAVRAGEVPVDLVITDFRMPGISGLEVAREIRDARPNLPVIMISGYVNDQLRAQAAAAGVREIFSKPHEVEDIRDALQRLLAPSATLGHTAT